jgi:hypothetical protein
MDYLKNVNIKKDNKSYFSMGYFLNSPSVKISGLVWKFQITKKSEIRPRDFWQINLTCSGILHPIQLYTNREDGDFYDLPAASSL